MARNLRPIFLHNSENARRVFWMNPNDLLALLQTRLSSDEFEVLPFLTQRLRRVNPHPVTTLQDVAVPFYHFIVLAKNDVAVVGAIQSIDGLTIIRSNDNVVVLRGEEFQIIVSDTIQNSFAQIVVSSYPRGTAAVSFTGTEASGATVAVVTTISHDQPVDYFDVIGGSEHYYESTGIEVIEGNFVNRMPYRLLFPPHREEGED